MAEVPSEASHGSLSHEALDGRRTHSGYRRTFGWSLVLLTIGICFYGDTQKIRNFLGDTSKLPTTFQWDYKYNINASKHNQHQGQAQEEIDWSSWINTTGISLRMIQGDPNLCRDVIYTGHNHDATGGPDQRDDFVKEGWKGLSYAVKAFKMLSQTCLVYFQVANPLHQDGIALHPVWGRLPATALMMQTFPKAKFLLYFDSDAIIASPDQNPTTMYKALSFDGYGENATFQALQPGLIVNKPYHGWLCGECEKFGLGHGCFNSGALLWRRSKAAKIVLHAWWESRHSNQSENFFIERGPFHGWTGTKEKRCGDKMGEQNRLMYIYRTNRTVHDAVWPVPRQISFTNSSSCPNAVEGHVPCLQTDAIRYTEWNVSKASCFINHYTDSKETIKEHAALMLNRSV